MCKRASAQQRTARNITVLTARRNASLGGAAEISATDVADKARAMTAKARHLCWLSRPISGSDKSCGKQLDG
jgi:hypothetical protein